MSRLEEAKPYIDTLTNEIRAVKYNQLVKQNGRGKPVSPVTLDQCGGGLKQALDSLNLPEHAMRLVLATAIVSILSWLGLNIKDFIQMRKADPGKSVYRDLAKFLKEAIPKNYSSLKQQAKSLGSLGIQALDNIQHMSISKLTDLLGWTANHLDKGTQTEAPPKVSTASEAAGPYYGKPGTNWGWKPYYIQTESEKENP